MGNMLDIKVLGRGGFGVVSSAQILGRVFLELGFWATSIPRFGAERQGAPVHADVRISSTKIRIKSFLDKGDLTIVLDQNAFQVQEILAYSKPKGVV
ncbi:MAG: 2-oxoacid:acceptor oxidoreductase family protein, partial [Candidatus Hodarchaeales archaeon]